MLTTMFDRLDETVFATRAVLHLLVRPNMLHPEEYIATLTVHNQGIGVVGLSNLIFLPHTMCYPTGTEP